MTAFSRIATYQGASRMIARSGMFTGPSEVILHDARAGRATVDRCLLGSMTVGRVVSSGNDVDVAEHIGVTFAVPFRGELMSEAGGRTFRARPGESLLFSPNRRRSRVVGAGERPYLAAALILPVRELSDTAERLGVAPSRLRQLEAFGLRLDSAGSTLTAEMVMTTRVILGEIERNSPRLALAETHLSWSRLVAEKLVELLAGTDLIQLPEASGGGKAQRHVRVALEFMHAHYADIISMADVAAACGISIRSLEYAFKSVWGTSPQAALTMIRLDEARSILSKPNEARSVTQAALACGFGHVGRFAAAYRSKFGETPSRTLSRA